LGWSRPATVNKKARGIAPRGLGSNWVLLCGDYLAVVPLIRSITLDNRGAAVRTMPKVDACRRMPYTNDPTMLVFLFDGQEVKRESTPFIFSVIRSSRLCSSSWSLANCPV
jgi:hypothetical protein